MLVPVALRHFRFWNRNEPARVRAAGHLSFNLAPKRPLDTPYASLQEQFG
jgi:hypothetical protein